MDRLAALLHTHLTRYPQSELADVYKLLHQATFGPGHAIASKKAAREWLEEEAGKLTPSLNEPLVESVHPDGQIVRLHLRPYLARRGSLKWLLDAFVRSADQVQGDPDIMAQRWSLFHSLCEPDGPYAAHFDRRELVLFGQIRAREGWSAVQHSPAYLSAYHPAYRVLTRGEAEALCDKLKVAFEVV